MYSGADAGDMGNAWGAGGGDDVWVTSSGGAAWTAGGSDGDAWASSSEGPD